MSSGVRRPAALALVAIAATVLAGCGASGSPGAGGSHDTITLYSGQHEQTTDALVAGFEKATGITVKVRNDDEDVFDDQIQTEGSRSPADVFYTENTRRCSTCRSTTCSPRSTGLDARPDTPQVQLAAGRLGRRLGTGQRPGLQPVVDLREPAADVGAAAGRPEVQGPARHRPRRDRLPADRHVDDQAVRHGRDPEVARGSEGERRQRPHLSRQRDDRRRGQPRQGRLRPHQPVLLVPPAAPRSARRTTTRRSRTSRRTTRATSSTSPARRCSQSSKHQAAAQQFLAYPRQQAGPGDHRPQHSFEYPIASGVTTTPARDSVRPAAAEPDRPRPARRRLGGDRTAASRRSCCERPRRGGTAADGDHRPVGAAAVHCVGRRPPRATGPGRDQHADRRWSCALPLVFLLIVAHQRRRSPRSDT